MLLFFSPILSEYPGRQHILFNLLDLLFVKNSTLISSFLLIFTFVKLRRYLFLQPSVASYYETTYTLCCYFSGTMMFSSFFSLCSFLCHVLTTFKHIMKVTSVLFVFFIGMSCNCTYRTSSNYSQRCTLSILNNFYLVLIIVAPYYCSALL